MTKHLFFTLTFLTCTAYMTAAQTPTEVRHALEQETIKSRSQLETYDQALHTRMQEHFKKCETVEIGAQKKPESCAFPKLIHAVFVAAHATMHHTQNDFDIVSEKAKAHFAASVDQQMKHKIQASTGESTSPLTDLARMLAFSKMLHAEKDSTKRIMLDTVRKEDNNTTVLVHGNGEDLILCSKQYITYLQSFLAEHPYNTMHTTITPNADYTLITITHRISQGQKRDILNPHDQSGAIQYLINLIDDEYANQQKDPTRAGCVQVDKDTTYYISPFQNGSNGLSGEVSITLPLEQGIQYLFNMHLIKPEDLKQTDLFAHVWPWPAQAATPAPTTTSVPKTTART